VGFSALPVAFILYGYFLVWVTEVAGEVLRKRYLEASAVAFTVRKGIGKGTGVIGEQYPKNVDFQ